MSYEAKSLVMSMLTLDYQARPYAQDLLEDPWFEKHPQRLID